MAPSVTEAPAPRGRPAFVLRLDELAHVDVTDYEAVATTVATLATAEGSCTLSVLTFSPDGSLGTHVAGRDQLLIPIGGRGWLEVEGVRGALAPGWCGLIRAGQRHAKGADDDTEMVALVVQSPSLDLGGAWT